MSRRTSRPHTALSVVGLGLLMVVSAGCTSSNDSSGTPTVTRTPSEPVPAQFAAGAERICADLRDQLTTLGRTASFEDIGPDPLLEPLIRPGTEIYDRAAADFRTLADQHEPTGAALTYTRYFEVIDAVLHARLRIGGSTQGADRTAGRELEARFQEIAAEQAEVAGTAGLTACDFDATDALFAR